MSQGLRQYQRTIGKTMTVTVMTLATAGVIVLADKRPCRMRELDAYKLAGENRIRESACIKIEAEVCQGELGLFTYLIPSTIEQTTKCHTSGLDPGYDKITLEGHPKKNSWLKIFYHTAMGIFAAIAILAASALSAFSDKERRIFRTEERNKIED